MDRADRVVERIRRIVVRRPDLVNLWREVTPILTAEVPHFEAPCFFTVDPECRIVTSHFQEGLPEIPGEWLAREYAEDDFNSMTSVLASPAGIGTLHAATAGRPERSVKYHVEMQPFGCEQELVVALRTPDRAPWGSIGLYRETGRPLFSEPEQRLLVAAAPVLADGVRHGLLAAQAREPDLAEAPGVIVLDGYDVVSATPSAAYWLDALGRGLEDLPVAVLSAAGDVASGRPGAGGPDTKVCVCGPTGRWVALHAGPLVDATGRAQVCVVLDAARPEHLEALLMRAHQLTPRERDVAGLVLRGLATEAIAAELSISPLTVQQHLAAVFDKTGVRSRRELVADVFRSRFEPRVRDNEARTKAARASRGGPKP
ncbi:helix-turn-helix transcriptional regulator [Nocardioides bizhenqiangii]|uniref:LuxR C-terminal-related transcriptional regulator n=1 Tax=Nocardioides bizhenqiangii TaxID=3095076 RepID=A0ABZ0ZSP9_9ACTN|nr:MULTISPECIES: LuxR C-terminal-related transcriptional regulator [unclassified Nocardioides]MDZ5622679.1 LuxR C-terminal-related transcriptional regulator [Nocardioides sp. HM23]WQQ26946.1 LuxR C-terminal-related transcriptional regulator [Nocardioides sp. HM61]